MARVACVAIFLSAIIACIGARSVVASEAQRTVQVRDSADVRIISLGRVEELSAPEVTADLVFSTRERGIELYRVGDAVLLGNGGVALANTGDTEVLLLSEDGSLVRRVGGRGEGPGEFGVITALLTADSGFLAYDTRLGRLSSFSETGEFLESSRLSPQSALVDLKPLAHDPAGNTLAILGVQRHYQPSGMKRDTTPLLSYTGLETAPDTLGLLPAQEWAYGSSPDLEVLSRQEAGFGRDIVASALGDRALIGDTDALSLSIYAADGGLKRRIHGSGGGWTVTAEEFETSRAERLTRRADPPDWYVDFVENLQYPETHPAFHSAVLGPDEMVWIGLAARPDEETRRWLVIGPDGQPQGSLGLPARARVLAIDADRYVLLQRDALDVEEVRLYRYR